MWIFRKPPPPPKTFYQKNPISTIAVLLTAITIFVLGPIGVIYNGMSEELKSVKVENKETRGAIVQNQLAIKEILTRQEMIIKAPGGLKTNVPEKKQQMKVLELKLKPIPPEYFGQYLKLSPSDKIQYKTYLKTQGYDVKGLPN